MTVYADEDMVKTVLRNLLSNAIKFTYPGGQIDITLSPLPGYVLTSVKDNGKGIAKDMQAKIKNQ
ncbi:MAG: ATP-binding protein [Odoribacter sp.]